MHPAQVRKFVPPVNDAVRRITVANQRLLNSPRQENLELALNEYYGAIVMLAAASGLVSETHPGDLVPDPDEFVKLVWEVQVALDHHHFADAQRLCWPVT